MTNADQVDVQYVTGGGEQGDSGKTISHHGLLDIEDQVVSDIADFIKAN